jgi:hypothetical protein
MPFNLLLLPLLGGFVFARFWNVTRYHVLRSEKEKLLIMAALAGFGWLVIAYGLGSILGALIPCRPDLFCLPTWWSKHVPFEYSGTSLLAFALGVTLWRPLNKIYKKEWAIDRAITLDSAPFELLLKKAQDQTKTVAVTMKNGKVYVGFVIHTFNPALPTRYIQILPTKSGHRDDENKWLVFTTFYSQALDKIDKDYEMKLGQLEDAAKQLEAAQGVAGKNKKKQAVQTIPHLQNVISELNKELDELSEIADDFGIVLPVAEIVSINIYSEYVHANYFPPALKNS